MGNNFASHGLRDEATHEQRDVDIRQTKKGERPDENEVVETNTQKSDERHNGATNAGLEANRTKSTEANGTKTTEANEFETKSREDAEGRSASTVHRSLWDEENGTSGRTKVGSESETLRSEPWNRSPDLFSPLSDSTYKTAKTERSKASSCPKDQQPKNMTSMPLRRKARKTLIFATTSEESEDEGFRSGATTRRTKTRKKEGYSSRRRREKRSSS